jgi:putative acetyltransferase
MALPSNILITAPRSAADLESARALFVEYSDSLGFSLAYQGFQAELDGLPGDYAPPTGALLLAFVDNAVAGTVGLRRLTDDACEMKRLFVRPAYRASRTLDGMSIGRTLAIAIVDRARTLGYHCIRLDTIVGRMNAAIALYRSMGFVEISPYFDSPVPGTMFMEKRL